MAVESPVDYIHQLVASNPVGATDDRNTADDHLRLIKKAILGTFPLITGPLTVTHTELNLNVGAASTLASLSARATKYSLSISAINTRVNTLSVSVSVVQADVARISQTVSVVIADVVRISVTVASIWTRVGTLSVSVSVVQSDVARISQTVSVAIASIARISQTVSVVVAAVGALSTAQTWQTFTIGVDRISGDAYQNDTDRDIMVAVSNPVNNGTMVVNVDDVTPPVVTICSTPNGSFPQFAFIVPKDHYYSVTFGVGGSVGVVWAELR